MRLLLIVDPSLVHVELLAPSHASARDSVDQSLFGRNFNRIAIRRDALIRPLVLLTATVRSVTVRSGCTAG